jgi:hypothetical protein
MKNKKSMDFRPPTSDLREYPVSELGRRFLVEKIETGGYGSIPPRPSGDYQKISPRRLQREYKVL